MTVEAYTVKDLLRCWKITAATTAVWIIAVIVMLLMRV